MGVESFLLSSTIAGVLAQRLVRRLCDSCKKPRSASEADITMMGLPLSEEITIYEPVGCPRCNQTGYEGRVGIYELIVADETFRRLLHDDASEQAIAAHAFAQTPTLASSGYEHVRAGVTSMSEVLRVVQEAEAGA